DSGGDRGRRGDAGKLIRPKLHTAALGTKRRLRTSPVGKADREGLARPDALAGLARGDAPRRGGARAGAPPRPPTPPSPRRPPRCAHPASAHLRLEGRAPRPPRGAAAAPSADAGAPAPRRGLPLVGAGHGGDAGGLALRADGPAPPYRLEPDARLDGDPCH